MQGEMVFLFISMMHPSRCRVPREVVAWAIVVEMGVISELDSIPMEISPLVLGVPLLVGCGRLTASSCVGRSLHAISMWQVSRSLH